MWAMDAKEFRQLRRDRRTVTTLKPPFRVTDVAPAAGSGPAASGPAVA